MSPPLQEEEASPSVAKKAKARPMVRRTRRKKIQRKVIPIPLVLETNLEMDEEDEEDKKDNLPLNQRTCLARASQEERRRSSNINPPFIPIQPIEVTTSEDEKQ